MIDARAQASYYERVNYDMETDVKKEKGKMPLLARTVLAVAKGVGDEITGDGFRLSVPDLESLDPDRFNRIELSCDNEDVTISIFHGHGAVEVNVPEFDITRPPAGQEIPMALMVLDNFAEGKGPLTPEDAKRMAADIRKTFLVLSAPAVPKQMTGPEDFPKPSIPQSFVTDYRVENPGLHKLYVGYALETILVAKACVDALYAMSRWPASHMAQLLWSEVGRTIVADAAWWDAAALIGAKIDLTDYLPEHSSPEVEEAVMRAQETV